MTSELGLLELDASYPLAELDKGAFFLEKGLNICGYFFGLSLISATARTLLGVALNVHGVTGMVFYTLREVYDHGTPEGDIDERKLQYYVQHCQHGQANIIRAFFEVLPCNWLYLIPYDLKYRYPYPIEVSDKSNLLEQSI